MTNYAIFGRLGAALLLLPPLSQSWPKGEWLAAA
jgi:hypothetical protein